MPSEWAQPKFDEFLRSGASAVRVWGAMTYNGLWARAPSGGPLQGQSPGKAPVRVKQGKGPWSWKLFCICINWGVGQSLSACLSVCTSVCVSVCMCVSLSLVDIASAEQTAASHAALMKIINFDDAQNIERAERYLLATALSTHPTEATLKHLLVSISLSIDTCCFVNPFKRSDTSKCSGPHWSNPSFSIFWHSGTLALRTERQSARMSKD